jgi:hypothetical protein
VFIATIVVSVILAAFLAMAASMKLRRNEELVQSYIRLGIPLDKLNYLAFVLLAGAAGLLLGLVWAPIGIAAAIGVVLYFLGAIAVHLRAKDTKGLGGPATYLVLGIIALTLRVATL